MKWLGTVVIVLVLLGVAAIAAIVVAERHAKKRRAHLLREGLAKLKANKFALSRVFNDTDPPVAMDAQAKRVAFLFAEGPVAFEHGAILQWQPTWLEHSGKGKFSTSNHKVEINVNDVRSPRILVECPDFAVMRDLEAALNVIANG